MTKILSGIGFSNKAVWGRSSRRHSAFASNVEDLDEEDVAFGFKILVEADSGGQAAGSKVLIRWIKGHDKVLFESFCGMMKRKIET